MGEHVSLISHHKLHTWVYQEICKIIGSYFSVVYFSFLTWVSFSCSYSILSSQKIELKFVPDRKKCQPLFHKLKTYFSIYCTCSDVSSEVLPSYSQHQAAFSVLNCCWVKFYYISCLKMCCKPWPENPLLLELLHSALSMLVTIDSLTCSFSSLHPELVQVFCILNWLDIGFYFQYMD